MIYCSFAGNVFLVTDRSECFIRFREAVNTRISTTGAEDVTQYLLITRRVWAIGDCQRRYNQTLFPFLENMLT